MQDPMQSREDTLYPRVVIDFETFQNGHTKEDVVMLKSLTQATLGESERIHVFLLIHGKLLYKNSIDSRNMNTLIKVVGRDSVTAYDEHKEPLEGNNIYQLLTL